MKDYYVGFDIGTESVGWAVSDFYYNLCKFHGKSMRGYELFDECNTAVDRRTFRNSRKRIDRKRQRIAWLQMLFDEEISKVDISFFQRLKESNLYLEDKSTNVPYAVFADKNYTDVDYHNAYPTIYHLRKDLIESEDPHDIRLVYLALHHLIKNRGHFLFDNLNSDYDSDSSFDFLYDDLVTYLKEEMGIVLECSDSSNVADVLKDKSKSRSVKKKELSNYFQITKKNNPQEVEIITLLCGLKGTLSTIFSDKTLDDAEKNKIVFDNSFDENEDDYIAILQDRYELIEKVKAIYDWAVLADILNGESYISFAKVKTYEEHKNDLRMLKDYVKERCFDKYDEIFRVSSDIPNYTSYSGKYKENGKTGVLARKNKATQEEFCSYLLKSLKNLDHSGYEDMFLKIENNTFMPKIVVKDNGVIPMQVNEKEVKMILNNASKYLPFLSEKDCDGISVSDKILKIFQFRIPYYVGPLNTHSDKSWLIRGKEKIYPWNFDKVVDVEKSAEAFITNLTSKCTYLFDRDVIPKNSILYSKFMVLNELNNLRLDGEKPDVQFKQDIFNDLFMHHKKVTRKSLVNYIKSKTGETPDITGIDGDFKTSMRSAIELSSYDLSLEEKEVIISSITIFGDDKKLLKKRLKKNFADKLSDDDIKKISKLKYKDWGRFSKDLLTEIYDFDENTGEVKDNIINSLWNTNDNFMELLGSKYNFQKSIENANRGIQNSTSIRKMVETLYVSPKIKRPIYQSLLIMKEIEKIQKNQPKKIFVEMTRSDGVKGDKGRKHSRKKCLEKLYKNCKEDSGELWESLEKTPDNEFQQDKLYLYYTQFGKCMYTGESIDISDLFNQNIYDIDHIFPRSKVKDDSLDNRVLVKRIVNSHKDNDYPLDKSIRDKMKSFWYVLYSKELISKKKFERLTRSTSLTDSELSDFIARQLVETSQSTKAVADILKVLYPNTEIVYVKARYVSDIRNKSEYKMLKCRTVNDMHHAKDAYLNIVVGNVYNERFTHNKINFIKGLQTKKYSMNKMFNYDVKNAWIAEDNYSLNIVKKTMNKNNPIYRRYSFVQHGALFKVLPLKKGKGQAPLKENSPLSNINKYGGYDKPTSSYFSYVEFEGKKGKKSRQLVPIDSYLRKEYEGNPIQYLTERLGLVNPKILIPIVKYNACIEIDGFRMNISSKSNGGKQLIYKSAMPLVLGYQSDLYVRNITKLLESPEDHTITEFDGVSFDENIDLFDSLVNKMCNTILKVKYSDMGKKINQKRDVFVSLDLRTQCFVLNEILKILHCNVLMGDLSKIGLAKKSGALTSNSVLTEIKNVKSIYLVNQSVTGLFENKIDLLNM